MTRNCCLLLLGHLESLDLIAILVYYGLQKQGSEEKLSLPAPSA